MTNDHSNRIGRYFEDTPKGNLRRYWFVGGISTGFLSDGAVRHWGMEMPPLLLILVGGVCILILLTVKQRGDWDV